MCHANFQFSIIFITNSCHKGLWGYISKLMHEIVGMNPPQRNHFSILLLIFLRRYIMHALTPLLNVK